MSSKIEAVKNYWRSIIWRGREFCLADRCAQAFLGAEKIGRSIDCRPPGAVNRGKCTEFQSVHGLREDNSRKNDRRSNDWQSWMEGNVEGGKRDGGIHRRFLWGWIKVGDLMKMRLEDGVDYEVENCTTALCSCPGGDDREGASCADKVEAQGASALPLRARVRERRWNGQCTAGTRATLTGYGPTYYAGKNTFEKIYTREKPLQNPESCSINFKCKIITNAKIQSFEYKQTNK